MEYRNLYDMITYLQYGTNLHIGVLFFDNYGNDMCKLPHRQKIHSGLICEEFKKHGKRGFERCFRCRNMAIRKAMTSKEAFGGLCINGVYEYTHPVVIGGDVACMIYIGNIMDSDKGYERIINNIGENEFLINSMEKNFTYEDCKAVGDLLEGHIRILLEKYSDNQEDANPLIKNIKSYIESNLEFDIDISCIAEIFHYNNRYLGRLFKKETGMSVSDYINVQRIERAKGFLEDNNGTVIDISNRVGFNNVTYFNRLFKEIVGMTPTQYRESFCKNTGSVHKQYQESSCKNSCSVHNKL